MVAGGIFLGIWIWGRLLARYGDDPKEDPQRGSQVALWIVVGVFVGARLMYVAVEVARYLAADVTSSMRRYLESGDGSGLTPEELSRVQEIKIHGMYWPVDAQVFSISSLSAHADHAELVQWLRPLRPPAKTFVVHGEPSASDAFRRYLADRLGWPAVVPELGSVHEL